MNRQESQRRRVRSKFQCPDALRDLISAANFVSPEVVESSFMAWAKFNTDQTNNPSAESRANYAENCRRAFSECVAAVPDETRKRWVDSNAKEIKERSPGRPDEWLEIAAMYELVIGWFKYLRIDMDALRKVALYFESLRATEECEETTRFPDTFGSFFTTVGTVLHLTPSGWAAAVDGVDGDRIRICKICDRIFWANRKDSVTDSPACLNILRQRRFNEKKREYVNAQRAENYDNKKRGIVK